MSNDKISLPPPLAWMSSALISKKYRLKEKLGSGSYGMISFLSVLW